MYISKCPSCYKTICIVHIAGLSFPAQASLYQHLLSACVHFSRLVCLKCKICAEIFSSQYSMRCHLLQHHIEEVGKECWVKFCLCITRMVPGGRQRLVSRRDIWNIQIPDYKVCFFISERELAVATVHRRDLFSLNIYPINWKIQ